MLISFVEVLLAVVSLIGLNSGSSWYTGRPVAAQQVGRCRQGAAGGDSKWARIGIADVFFVVDNFLVYLASKDRGSLISGEIITLHKKGITVKTIMKKQTKG